MGEVQPDGQAIEVCLIGKEGSVGLPVIFGFRTSGVRVVSQVEGTAYRVDVDTLRRVLPQWPELETKLQRFSMMLAIESMQMAACNRLHGVEERLASRVRRNALFNRALDRITLPSPLMIRKSILRRWPELVLALSLFGLIYLWWRG